MSGRAAIGSSLRDRTRSEAFRAWFGGSRVVNAAGEPLVVYHSTSAARDFGAFRPKRGDIGMHFGTIGQAEDRALHLKRSGKAVEDGHRVLPVYLAIQNPLRLPDMMAWTAFTVGSAVADTHPELADAYGRDLTGIRRFLARHGYDGIVYRNTWEVQGSEPLVQAYIEAQEDFFSDRKARTGSRKGTLTREEETSPLWLDVQDARGTLTAFREAHAEDSWIAFAPSQIKSVFNSGAWDPRSADLLDRHALPQIQHQPEPDPVPATSSRP